MVSRPFFSIIMPTYNRAAFLQAAVKIFLDQTFKDFEIVIIDDCSTDNTSQIVASIKDKRIRYIRNKKNLGQEPNFKKSFSLGKGKYLFITGDDDYVLFPDTLEKVHKILTKYHYGFVRLNLIEKKFIGTGLRKSIISYEKDIVVPKGKPADVIVDFTRTVALGHMAGLIFKNEGDASKKLFSLQETPWIRIIYELVHKYGGMYLSKYYMVITWSQLAILNLYDVHPKKPLMMEEYVAYIYKIMPSAKKEIYKWKYYKTFAILQPAIKLYSGNRNLIAYDKRLFLLEPRLKRSIVLWAMLGGTFITPKFVLRLIRILQHKKRNHLASLQNMRAIYKRYSVFNKQYGI